MLVVLTLSLTSCSNEAVDLDDDTFSIAGKWQFTKEGDIINNHEVLIDYQHTPGCTKDYTEIMAGGVIKDHYYETSKCIERIDFGAWVRYNNVLVLTYPNEPDTNAEIMELTNTTLKLKFVLATETRVIVCTKIP
jgi:hypothetical protein